MSATQSFSLQDQDQIRVELDKILTSEGFVNSKRISNLLRYVVEETLAGRRDRIKAFSIAQDVFGRDANFDQQRDPIVRVEASRLRKCLDKYYESYGQGSVLRINIPKGGYAPTFARQESTADLARPWVPKMRGLAGIAIILALWFGWLLIEPQNSTENSSRPIFLAVLPLTYVKDDIRASRLADNFADSTITLLARLPDLSVMAHASMMEFEQKQVSLRLLKEEFGITHALRGSIETLNDDLRIRVQVIDTETSETIWSDSLEDNLSNIWALQDELAVKLLKALSLQLESIERGSMLGRYTESTEALMLYRQGLFMILPPNENNRLEAARQLFGRVREIDPEFAGGYAGAAWSYALPVLFHTTRTPDEHVTQAIKLAKQAIEVDPGFGAGYVVLGFTQALAGEKVEALENVRLASAIQPGDAFVQFLLGVTFILSGIPEDAFGALDEAIRLNPIEKRAPYLNVYSIGRFANREYQSTLNLIAQNQARNGPHGPHMDIFRAAAYAQLGKHKEASAVINELKSTSPDFPYAAWLESWLGRGDHLRITLQKLSDHGLIIGSEHLPD